MSNSHYAVVTFKGDFGGVHPDPELNGESPRIDLIACGPEDFCWDAAARWTTTHPLKQGQEVEVLARDPSVIRHRS